MKYLNSIIIGLLLGCLLELSPLNSFSHPAPIDPSKLTFLKDSIKKLDSLVKATNISNPSLSLKYAQKALSYARKLRTAEDLIQGYSLMGQAFLKKDKDSSFIYFNKALKLADSAKIDAPKPFLLLNIATLYYIAKDFKRAIGLLDTCIKFANAQKDYSIISRAFIALGNLNIDIKNRDGALIMYDSANKIAVRYSIPRQIGISLGNIARFEKDPVKAFKLNKEAIRYLIKSKGNEEALAKIYINMGYR